MPENYYGEKLHFISIFQRLFLFIFFPWSEKNFISRLQWVPYLLELNWNMKSSPKYIKPFELGAWEGNTHMILGSGMLYNHKWWLYDLGIHMILSLFFFIICLETWSLHFREQMFARYEVSSPFSKSSAASDICVAFSSSPCLQSSHFLYLIRTESKRRREWEKWLWNHAIRSKAGGRLWCKCEVKNLPMAILAIL